MSTTAPVHTPDTDRSSDLDTPWVVIVWDDPVNLMDYVVFVFQEIFGFTRSKATRLMLQVHHEGKAAVFSGAREQAELHVQQLQSFGLWASMER